MKKLFDTVSVEDLDMSTGSADMNVTDVIVMEDNTAEVSAIAAEINSDIAMIENAQEVTAGMESRIALEEKILEAGSVSVGAAQIATFSLEANALALGIDPQSVSISAESIEQAPDTALKVSVESAKDTVKKVIEKIKAFISKMWSKLKKMAAKIMTSVTDFEKKFKALEEKAGKLGELKKDDAGKISESEGKKITKLFYERLAIGAKGISDINFTDLAKTTQATSSTEAIEKVLKDLGEKGVVTGAFKAIGENKDLIKNLANAYDGIPSSEEVSAGQIVFSRKDGSTVKAMIFTGSIEKVDDKEVEKVTTVYVTGSAKKGAIDKLGKDVLTLKVDEIVKAIEAGKDLAKGYKAFAESVDDVLKATEDKIKALKPDDKENEMSAKVMSGISANVIKFGSDSLLGYIGTMRNLSTLANINIGKYESSDKKEDK